jgi:hypothetical protein
MVTMAGSAMDGGEVNRQVKAWGGIEQDRAANIAVLKSDAWDVSLWRLNVSNNYLRARRSCQPPRQVRADEA